MDWYAFFVQTGQEDVIKDLIYKKFDPHAVNCRIPKRKVPEKRNGSIQDAIKVLFPGYIFLRIKMDFLSYYEILKTPKVYSLLNYRNHKDKSIHGHLLDNSYKYTKSEEEDLYFKKIPDEEMSLILQLIDENDVLNYSQIFIENSTVSVESGPLKGMEGIIKKIDLHKKRAKISVKFMDSEKIIDVGIGILKQKMDA